jgi:hypothetical protein
LLSTLLPQSSKTGSSRSRSVSRLMCPLRTGYPQKYPWTPTSRKSSRLAGCCMGVPLLQTREQGHEPRVLLLPGHQYVTNLTQPSSIPQLHSSPQPLPPPPPQPHPQLFAGTQNHHPPSLVFLGTAIHLPPFLPAPSQQSSLLLPPARPQSPLLVR